MYEYEIKQKVSRILEKFFYSRFCSEKNYDAASPFLWKLIVLSCTLPDFIFDKKDSLKKVYDDVFFNPCWNWNYLSTTKAKQKFSCSSSSVSMVLGLNSLKCH